jgi:hypothetical protein
MRAGKKHWSKGFSLLRFAFCLSFAAPPRCATRYLLTVTTRCATRRKNGNLSPRVFVMNNESGQDQIDGSVSQTQSLRTASI